MSIRYVLVQGYGVFSYWNTNYECEC